MMLAILCVVVFVAVLLSNELWLVPVWLYRGQLVACGLAAGYLGVGVVGPWLSAHLPRWAVASLWAVLLFGLGAWFGSLYLQRRRRTPVKLVVVAYGCQVLEVPNLVPGWGCCACGTYNQNNRAFCRCCRHERCTRQGPT